MYNEITFGLGMTMLIIIIHAFFMTVGVKLVEWRKNRFGSVHRHWMRSSLVAVFTCWMFLAIILEAWLWALLYLTHPQIVSLQDMETAFYFSMVTFTTLGYGDVVLEGHWRTLAAIQAANGVIIFGWTTALIFDFIQKIYKKDNL